MNTNVTESQKIKVTFDIEKKSRSRALRKLVNMVLALNPEYRATVADMVRVHGYQCHVGGCHVAVLNGGVRLAMFTHPTAPDFN